MDKRTLKQKSKSTKLKVAITGNIGSGKSTFAKFIQGLGYPLVYSDDISKDILAHDSVTRTEIVKAFGAQSYHGEEINTKYIADLVFSDPKNLKRINSILHPRVQKKLGKILDELLKTSKIVFVEAALIYEAKIEKMFDFIVLITADKEIRMKRYISDKGSSKEDFINREKNQSPQEIKQKRADFIFSNNGSTAELKQKAGLLTKILEASLE
jgi:dephospho-CoA kinase